MAGEIQRLAASLSQAAGCKSPGKHPIPFEGHNGATTDPGQIRAWWAANPGANIGIPTGARSGFDVLDIDPGRMGAEAFQGLLAEAGAEAPDTLQTETGSGGTHYLFGHAEGVRNRADIFPGIDIKGRRLYSSPPVQPRIRRGVCLARRSQAGGRRVVAVAGMALG